ACFAAGIGALAVALASPLDAMAERSFTAHMLQHLLLMLVAPPLLVWSRPVYAMLWAFRPATRRRIGQWWAHRSRLRGLYDACMRPLTAWMLASVALWCWHVPALYDLALRNEAVHVAEHLCFFLTSLSFWTLVERPWQRHAGYGTAIVMLAAFALHNGLLGAVLSFSSVPLYLAYAGGADTAARVADQQLAGLIMWIPAGVVHLAAFAALFPGWLNGIGNRARAGRVGGSIS
ncbi:cytochrome c oxidase assembly protein, partial [Oxalobacteraceae bacterium OM1]